MRKLKKTLPSFASTMCMGQIDLLEELVRHQYEEFLDVFQILKESTDDILKLEYKQTGRTCLEIEVTTESDAIAEQMEDDCTYILGNVTLRCKRNEVSRYGNQVLIRVAKK